MSDLFSQFRPEFEEIYPEVYLLTNFVRTQPLIELVEQVTQQAPFRKMMTPMGHYTGIALSNCGELGWTSDAKGYRYSAVDPLTDKPWPKMPSAFAKLANAAAQKAGFSNFESDACLINEYPVGSSLGAHQDKNEADFSQPIVSVSIGLPATFQIFGMTRSGKATNLKLLDGDVLVWGGKSRLIYHGVRRIQLDPQRPQLKRRLNITLRRAATR